MIEGVGGKKKKNQGKEQHGGRENSISNYVFISPGQRHVSTKIYPFFILLSQTNWSHCRAYHFDPSQFPALSQPFWRFLRWNIFMPSIYLLWYPIKVQLSGKSLRQFH